MINYKRKTVNTRIEELKKGLSTAFLNAGEDSNLAYKPEFVRNDAHHGQKVLTVIDRELTECESFFISVAFITKSGITPLLQTLKELEKRAIPGRILTTDYLMFSEPEALRTLAGLTNISLRMYQTESGPGFHTKGYLFIKDDLYRIVIGSANMTQNALTVNKEWNAKIISTKDGEFAKSVREEFERLWNDRRSLDFEFFFDLYKTKYEAIQKQRTLSKHEEITSIEAYRLQPNKMQVAFIDSLKKMLHEGKKKGLLISATGTGKTYASAFGVRDALRPKGKVLFIVHRKQILRQALYSYKQVFGSKVKMALLTGEDQSYDEILEADFVFAMITMISKKEVLHRFNKDEYSCIIIDEVHHAAAASYQKVMDYFSSDFWLGMTATPDRTDTGNIYELFDHNIAYEIRLQQALENDLLCPFHYFGIQDIAFSKEENGDELVKRAEKGDLRIFNKLTSDERVDYVLDKASYYGFSGDRVKGLVFCSSVAEAKTLSEKLNIRGFRTVALSGHDTDDIRQKSMERLVSENGKEALDYILTVNIFNEGVDLPDINQVIMLRPTESAIVFIQQLGRGLRKKDGKEYVVVLDFIGNYANNFLIPIALSGDRTYNKDNMRKYLMEGANVIPGCSTIHFDAVSKQQIFSAIDRASTPLKFLKEKYFNLRDRLGRMPTEEEFYYYGEIDPILFTEYKKASYYAFVRSVDKECGLEALSRKQEETLDYVSIMMANGKRPHELIAMQLLLEEGSVDERRMKERLSAYRCVFRKKDYLAALRVLDKSFVNTQSERTKYTNVELISDTASHHRQQLVRCAAYLKRINALTKADSQFYEALTDVVQCGLIRFKENYINMDEDNLVLYQKYSRKDVCRLLNWEKDDSSTVYGYRIKYNTCPIFVTYEKKDDISETTKYEDQFEDPQSFSWMTRSRVSLNSAESQKIIHSDENGLKLYLFIKKSDGEGTDFYYMGRVCPTAYQETTIADKNGRLLPIMNFKLRLHHPVRNDVYDYFTK